MQDTSTTINSATTSHRDFVPPGDDVPVRYSMAIETTSKGASIAFLEDFSCVRSIRIPPDQRSAAGLAPAVKALLHWSRDQGCLLDFISVADGPGSFTGLRVGVTTAKTLCYALRIPMVRIDSIAAIGATAVADAAAEITGTDVGTGVKISSRGGRLLVAINAFRGQVFAADFPIPTIDSRPVDQWAAELYRLTHGEDATTRVLDAAEWKKVVMNSGGDPKTSRPPGVDGPGDGDREATTPPTRWFHAGESSVFPNHDSEPGNASQSPSSSAVRLHRKSPDAVGLGLLGRVAASRGDWCDPLALVPRYLKPSAAEENAAK